MRLLIIGAALLAAWKTGLLNKLGVPFLPPNLYTLTQSDVEEIAGHYLDGRSTFKVNGITLGDALRLAIENHRIAAYTQTSKYCQGLVSPAQVAGGAGIAAMASGGVATSAGIASEMSSFTPALQGIGAIPIIGSIAAIGTAIFGFISHHHAEAVAKENKILCPLIPALNGQWQHIDSQISSGKLDGVSAQQAVLAVQQQAHQVIAEDSSSGALHAIGEQVDAITEAYQLILEKSGLIAASDVQSVASNGLNQAQSALLTFAGVKI